MNMKKSEDVEAEGFLFPFLMSTPVWGAGHIGLFLNVCLPSLLSPGNLPGLTANPQNRYLIYTRDEDEAELRAAPAFRRLSEIVAVEVILIREEITEPHRTMSNCHIDSIRRADEAGAAAIFLPPDCVWSNGSMIALERIARSGKSVVHMSGIRLDRDGFVPELANWYSDNNTVLGLAPRELVAMGLRHLHPISLTHFWKDFDGGLMPANLIWTVPNQGLLLRCFHLHPLMVKSQVRFAKFSSTIDDDLSLHACPDASRDYVVTDSDELLAFEMSGLSRVVGTVCSKASLEGVAAWAEVGTNKRHRQLIKNAIRLKATEDHDVAWAATEAESNAVVDSVAEINALGLTKLFVHYPSVFSSRLIAIALGRGDHFDQSAALLIGLLVRGITLLLRLNAVIYNKCFLVNGVPGITHPYWLIRKTMMATLQRSILRSDHNVVLIGADPQIVSEVKAQHPNIAVQAFAAGSVPDSTLLRRDGLGEVDLLATIDVDMLEEQPLMSRQIGGRQILLRLVGDFRPVDGTFDEIIFFGGNGTWLCSLLWHGLRHLRARGKTRSLIARLGLKAVGLLLLPFIYAGLALTACAVNSLGLLMDVMKSEHWFVFGRKGASLPAKPTR
jgi:hypothetical protein